MKKFKKIYIEITNNCNLHCSFCSKNTRKNKFIEPSEFKDILIKVKDYTNSIYLHVKGEPLLHPKLNEILQIVDKYNVNLNITTNGTLIEKNLKTLINCKNLKKINFSLHCENDMPNYLEKVFYNVDNYLKDKTIVYRLWTLSDGQFDTTSTNIVNEIIKHYKLSTETVDKILKENNIKLKDSIYLDKDNEFVWPEEEQEDESSGYCMALKTQIAILVDGTVVPCCLDCNGVVDLGNIHEHSLLEILNSTRYLELKKSFNDRKPSEKLCKKCKFKSRFNKEN